MTTETVESNPQSLADILQEHGVVLTADMPIPTAKEERSTIADQFLHFECATTAELEQILCYSRDAGYEIVQATNTWEFDGQGMVKGTSWELVYYHPSQEDSVDMPAFPFEVPPLVTDGEWSEVAVEYDGPGADRTVLGVVQCLDDYYYGFLAEPWIVPTQLEDSVFSTPERAQYYIILARTNEWVIADIDGAQICHVLTDAYGCAGRRVDPASISIPDHLLLSPTGSQLPCYYVDCWQTPKYSVGQTITIGIADTVSEMGTDYCYNAQVVAVDGKRLVYAVLSSSDNPEEL